MFALSVESFPLGVVAPMFACKRAVIMSACRECIRLPINEDYILYRVSACQSGLVRTERKKAWTVPSSKWQTEEDIERKRMRESRGPCVVCDGDEAVSVRRFGSSLML